MIILFIAVVGVSMETAYAGENAYIESQAQKIYEEMLEESGIISSNDSISYVSTCSARNVDVMVADVEKQSVSSIASYIEKDGELLDAYAVVYNAVATGRTAELKNTKIMGFKITVEYDYYYPSDNGYKDPYYKHGTLIVQANDNPMITSIGNFECVYMSQGTRTNESGSVTYSFATTVSRIEKSMLYAGNYYRDTTGDNGNPYFWKFGSSVEGGNAFSGIAFKFTFGNKSYSDYSIIMYDPADDMADLEDFKW